MSAPAFDLAAFGDPAWDCAVENADAAANTEHPKSSFTRSGGG